MSKLMAFNLLFQFSGFRLCRVVQKDDSESWGLLGPVLPLTGWRTPYLGLAKVWRL